MKWRIWDRQSWCCASCLLCLSRAGEEGAADLWGIRCVRARGNIRLCRSSGGMGAVLLLGRRQITIQILGLAKKGIRKGD